MHAWTYCLFIFYSLCFAQIHIDGWKQYLLQSNQSIDILTEIRTSNLFSKRADRHIICFEILAFYPIYYFYKAGNRTAPFTE